MMRREPRPMRIGARPSVAKSSFGRANDEPWSAARGFALTDAAEFIMRGVMITGATARGGSVNVGPGSATRCAHVRKDAGWSRSSCG